MRQETASTLKEKRTAKKAKNATATASTSLIPPTGR
jgi:hypothetical protein